jgi:hypothetical protein
MPGKTPPLRHDADGAAHPIPVADADPHSPRPPSFACLPTDNHSDARAEGRLEHDRRPADAMPRAPWVPTDVRILADGRELHRPEPIPRSEHYAKTPDTKIRTTAIPCVT